jgi:hypothetical protein
MNRELLERPFEPAQIRQRKGRNGVLDYVEGWNVIQRLNDALESAWSFDVVQHEIRDDEVVVLARLSAAGISKMQFGVSQITRERDSRKPVSLGDDLKAAATDALKKCATFLGVGLHLYGGKVLATSGTSRSATTRSAADVSAPGNGAQPTSVPHPARRPAATASASGLAARAASGDDRAVFVPGGLVTARQLDAIAKIGRAKGLEPQAVEGMSLRAFNRKPDELSQAEAAGLLKELSNLKRRVA